MQAYLDETVGDLAGHLTKRSLPFSDWTSAHAKLAPLLIVVVQAYLDETVGDLAGHLAKKPPMQHLPVVRWVLPRWQMGQEFLFECKKVRWVGCNLGGGGQCGGRGLCTSIAATMPTFVTHLPHLPHTPTSPHFAPHILRVC